MIEAGFRRSPAAVRSERYSAASAASAAEIEPSAKAGVAFQGSNLGMSRSRSVTISPAAAPTVVRRLTMAESLWRMASGVLAGTPSV